LRAVGGLRRQVRSIVSAEALLIALIGLVIGIALGAGNLYYALEIARRQIIGVGAFLPVFPGNNFTAVPRRSS